MDAGDAREGARAPHWEGTDVGLVRLGQLYDRLFVDDEWAVRGEREFTWWMAELPQRVRAGEPAWREGHDGPPVEWAWIEAETVVATDVDPEEAIGIAIGFNAVATQSAWIVDPVRRELVVSLRLPTDATDEERLVLLRTAVALQAAEAVRIGRAWEGKVASRPHPVSGERAEPDRLIAVPDALRSNETDGSLVPGAFRAVAELGREDGLWVLATDDPAGLTAEIPWSGATPAHRSERHLRTALFRLRTDEPHPLIGKGLLAVLELPTVLPVAEAVRLANALNLAERALTLRVAGLGAWRIRPVSATRASLAWSCFTPAVEILRLPNPDDLLYLASLAYDARNRTAWAHYQLERLAGTGS
ncbi:MAG: hypothetical protein RL338_1764 [Chloroflexota bacterium]|jgi:hypothetical protein